MDTNTLPKYLTLAIAREESAHAEFIATLHTGSRGRKAAKKYHALAGALADAWTRARNSGKVR
jgi:hypothetical protein